MRIYDLLLVMTGSGGSKDFQAVRYTANTLGKYEWRKIKKLPLEKGGFYPKSNA